MVHGAQVVGAVQRYGVDIQDVAACVQHADRACDADPVQIGPGHPAGAKVDRVKTPAQNRPVCFVLGGLTQLPDHRVQ